MDKIKITKDGFMWLLLSNDAALSAWEQGSVQLFALYNDESESSINSMQELDRALRCDIPIGVELGFQNEVEILRICPHCGEILLTSLLDYKYQCIFCDEDFFEFETDTIGILEMKPVHSGF